MTPEEFKQQGHAQHLKAFLDSASGKAFIEVVKDYGRPSSKSRQQYGGAEDVKLQMSLNYVAMENTFALVDHIKGLVSAPVERQHHPPIPALIPEDVSPEMLKAMGITIPEKIVFKSRVRKPKPVTV